VGVRFSATAAASLVFDAEGADKGQGSKDMIPPTGREWLGDQARVLVCWVVGLL
jgi:hypothetical protein